MKQLITEQQKSDVIANAIRNRQVAKISYNSDEPQGRGVRYIEPVEVGFNKNGVMLVRAWQLSGASFSNSSKGAPIPGWRSFKVVNIEGWRDTGEEFDDERPVEVDPTEEDDIVQTIEKVEPGYYIGGERQEFRGKIPKGSKFIQGEPEEED